MRQNPEKWEKTWGTRLSVSDQIKALEQDVEYCDALNEDKETFRRRTKLIEQFRLGAKRLCASDIWQKFLNHRGLGGLDVPEQARALGMTRQLVRNYNKGDLSFANWLAFLTDQQLELSWFDPLPDASARALAGYQLAAAWIEYGARWSDDWELPSEGDLRSILAVLEDPIVKVEGRDIALLTDREWHRVAAALGVLPEGVEKDTTQNLHERITAFASLCLRWAPVVAEVHYAIPHRWLERLDDEQEN
jgi:hypothetical protein